MCLAVPCRLLEVDGVRGRAEVGGATLEGRLDLLEGPRVGEYVLVHAGFALERIDEVEAEKTLALLDELGSA